MSGSPFVKAAARTLAAMVATAGLYSTVSGINAYNSNKDKISKFKNSQNPEDGTGSSGDMSANSPLELESNIPLLDLLDSIHNINYVEFYLLIFLIIAFSNSFLKRILNLIFLTKIPNKFTKILLSL